MKKTFLLLISLSLPVLLFSMTGITEEGKKVQLKDDYTWEYVKAESRFEQQTVLEEAALYRLAIREDKPILFEQYLSIYDKEHAKNTISILYFYAKNLNSWNIYLNASNNTYIELLQKGILYTEKYGKIFSITYPESGYSIISNLSFFWDYAGILEYKQQYGEALDLYMKLEKYYLETNQQFSFNVSESSLEVIQGKIYLMNLLKESK